MRSLCVSAALLLLIVGSAAAGPFGIFGPRHRGECCYQRTVTYTACCQPAQTCCDPCGQAQVAWQGGCGGTVTTYPPQQPVPTGQPPLGTPQRMPAAPVTGGQ